MNNMAKLNVVIPAVEVTVGDVTYRKVDRKAQAGDIVKALKSEIDLTEGAFYGPLYDSGVGNIGFKDDDNDFRYSLLRNYASQFEVYAPISEPISEPAAQPPTDTITFEGATWRKVDRDVREGDAIKFTDEDRSSYLTEAELYVVNHVDLSDDPQITDDDGDDYDAGGEDYEVYEKVAEEKAQEYREVKRKARVGERIKITNRVAREDRYEDDAEFIVKRADSDGDVYVDTETQEYVMVLRSEYVVLEPITKSAEPAQPERLAVGDYARVVSTSGAFVPSYIVAGNIVKITHDDESHRPFRAELTNGKNAGWFTESELVRATDEEVAAARREAVFAQFSVGDTVKLTPPDGKNPRFGRGNVDNGDLGKVTEIFRTHIVVDFSPKQRGWKADPSELTKLTAAEIADIERKQAEEAKWAAIGRKVNEFKVGDIVEAKRRLGDSEVILGEVCDVNDEYDESETHVAITSYVDGNYRSVDVLKLIVPVEQRFDREVDAA